MSIRERLGFEARRIAATSRGYFWLPCNTCGELMGGNEWRDVGGLRSSVPCRAVRGLGHGICQDCTADGVGQRAHERPFNPETCPYCARTPA